MTLADRLDEKADRLESNQWTNVPDTVAVMREAAAELRRLEHASWQASELRPRFDTYGQFDGYY